jgi:hypothetical protein
MGPGFQMGSKKNKATDTWLESNGEKSRTSEENIFSNTPRVSAGEGRQNTVWPKTHSCMPGPIPTATGKQKKENSGNSGRPRSMPPAASMVYLIQNSSTS